ncbi:MAG: hypothetical protein RLZZ440_368 [Planctomycetota bacterium]
MRHSIATTSRRLATGLAAVAGLAIGVAAGGTVELGFEAGPVAWQLVGQSDQVRSVDHAISPDSPHRGAGCERLVVESNATAAIELELPLEPAAVIDELRAAVWVRTSLPGARLGFRMRLVDPTGRQPDGIEILVAGQAAGDADRWERLEVGDVREQAARRLPAVRLEHGSQVGLEGAVVTAVVIDAAAAAGRHAFAIDDLEVTGLVTVSAGQATAVADSFVRPVAAEVPLAADPPAGLARGVLEVAGLPFFPRSIEANGEPFVFLADLGFNCVKLPAPATADQLAEARAAGLWVICPPPPIPDVDLREPENVPMLRNWDRVLAWDLGTGLSEETIEEIAEQGRRIRACDPRSGRPLIGSADSGLRAVSRHVDMLVARRTVLGTSLELIDWLEWLRERPRLARPGTPLLCTLGTELDPAAARQAAALAGVGGRGLAIDPESLALAGFSAVAGGARGILFTSSRRLDGDDPEARMRAAAVRETNLRLRLVEPWGAAGRFASRATTSSPEVQAFVMEAARARIVLAWRCVQGSQVVARRYEGPDVPGEDMPLTILVPGVPEAHRAWEVAPGGLRPARQQRVTGGVSVTLDAFTTHGIVLLSGDPAVTGHVQDLVRTIFPLELASARGLASLALGGAGDLLARLPPQAFSGPPPVAAMAMLTEAGRLAAAGESLAATEPATAVRSLRKAAAIAGQFERRIWENAVKAEGSIVANPLSGSDATLAEAWQFIGARSATAPVADLLTGGDMEAIAALAQSGWRHFAKPQGEITTAVEVIRSRPASGQACLRMIARPADPKAAPVVVETPPVWITTPPLAVPVGKLVAISAQVWVPEAITGSVDGLLVFDSLGGPALAERVGPSKDWRRLVLYRIVPPEAAGEPVTVTFALSGLGEARVDEVTVTPLERAVGGTPAALVSTSPGEQGRSSFPSPADLLDHAPLPGSSPPAAPPVAAPTATATWPGGNLAWPKLNPFSSANEPPPGPGGGTIDPFKRARGSGPSAP